MCLGRVIDIIQFMLERKTVWDSKPRALIGNPDYQSGVSIDIFSLVYTLGLFNEKEGLSREAVYSLGGTDNYNICMTSLMTGRMVELEGVEDSNHDVQTTLRLSFPVEHPASYQGARTTLSFLDGNFDFYELSLAGIHSLKIASIPDSPDFLVTTRINDKIQMEGEHIQVDKPRYQFEPFSIGMNTSKLGFMAEIDFMGEQSKPHYIPSRLDFFSELVAAIQNPDPTAWAAVFGKIPGSTI